MAEKITARLQTPEDASGERRDVHLITTSNEVIVHPDSEKAQTLEEYLEHGTSGGDPVIVAKTQPIVDRPTMWVQPLE